MKVHSSDGYISRVRSEVRIEYRITNSIVKINL